MFLANIAKVKRSRRLFLFECLKCIPFFSAFDAAVESFTF